MKPTASDVLVFLVARDPYDETALGCGALRRLDDETIEIKRMYVRPGRPRPWDRPMRILEALECEAAARGANRVMLETGDKSPRRSACTRGQRLRVDRVLGRVRRVRDVACYAKDLSERRLVPDDE